MLTITSSAAFAALVACASVAAGLIGAAVYAVAGLFGNGATGPILIALLLLASVAAVFARRVQQTTPSPATS